MTYKKYRRAQAAAAALVTAFLLLAGCGRHTGGEPVTPEDSPSPVFSEQTAAAADELSLLPGVTVSVPFPYSGAYVEDGSDDEVENIAAVTLTNSGGTDYRYLEFTVKTSSGELSFSASSVHAGTVTTVLNRDKTPYTEGVSAESADCPVCVEYDSPPSLHEELFSLKQTSGSFTIENVTGKDLSGTVTVYYKAADANGYLGGITFRTVIDGLKAGEVKWNPAGHMGSIVFVTYEE